MNKRFCKLGQYAAKAFFLFAMCGTTYSCKDDYIFDDGDPSWLGSSIYEYLESQGNYTNFVKLINDLGYKEVLARTGSKTLFVADDDAFATFYQSNAWGVSNYDQLSKSQKKLLLNSAMVNNAYLLEMMSSTPAGSGDNDLPQKGQALRRETAADVTDSVPHLFAEDIPFSYNTEDKDYWERFRNNDKGIYLALDASNPMMTHFLAAQMAKKDITDADFEIITGQKRDKNDAFIYDSKVLKQDITCQNGYINCLDKVLVNPQNMAEVLRTNGETKIFSHMIDRFSAPFYNATLTARYRLLYGNDVDSVWQKRYFSNRSQGNSALKSDRGTDPIGNPTGNAVKYYLNFDPGWNEYSANDQNAKEQDMGVIFCPNDRKLIHYFFDENGGGHFLVKTYAPDLVAGITGDTEDFDKVFQAIDQIPLDVIQELLNNLMKPSFNSAVPSKFETIKNSAQDPMFDEVDDYHRGKIQKVLMANNGIIYLMDEVTTPAQYAAVLAPTYTETDKQIFRYAIKDMEVSGTKLNYNAYLLAMSSRFSFFVPQDENFWYVDPLSFYSPEVEAGTTNLTGRAYKFTWDATKKSNQLSVTSYKYIYDPINKTGSIGTLVSNENVNATCYSNRLKDMLETHTIIHEDSTAGATIKETQTGVECDKHYFYTKNNAVLYVDNAQQRKAGMTVKGGWHLNGAPTISGANGEESIDYSTVIGFDDKSAQTNGYGNGFAYMIDEPIIPTIESVFSVMYNNPNFSKFFALCQTDNAVLEEIGLKTTAEKEKYTIFTNNKGLPCYSYKKDEDGNFTTDFGKIDGSDASNIRFFNNYRYTIYIPTNEAMEEAEKAGLPTWQDLRDILELDLEQDERKDLTNDELNERNQKVKEMIEVMINFAKYHFQDNSIFADTQPLKAASYETATLNSKTGTYRKVTVAGNGGGNLTITDATGVSRTLTADKNFIARDYITAGKANAIQNTITTSSSAVIHGINGVLNFTTYEGGKYSSVWESSSMHDAYFSRYRITE